MATKTKAAKPAAKKKAAQPAAKKPANPQVPTSTVVDSPNGDLPTGDVQVKTDDGTVTPQTDPNWDGFAALNGFVTVTGGEHAGRYGVARGVTRDGKQVVVITRDAESERITVDYTDLQPDVAGRR